MDMASLRSLFRLQEFDVHNNWLTGPLPAAPDLWPALTKLDVSNNHGVYANIGNVLQAYSQLQSLSLSLTQTTGVLPDTMDRLWNLQYLDLSKTEIEGELPPTFVRMSRLIALSLSGPYWNMTLPNELDALPELRTYICAFVVQVSLTLYKVPSCCKAPILAVPFPQRLVV